MRDAILPFYRLGAGAMAAVMLLATPLAAAAETLLVMRNVTVALNEAGRGGGWR